MPSFSIDTRSMSSSPLVNSLVKSRLFKTAPDIDKPPFRFIHTMDLSVVDTTLHDIPDLIIRRTEIWAVWRPQVGHKKVRRFLAQQFNCCTCAAQCAGALSCWNTKSLPDTLRIAGSSMTLLWRREVSKSPFIATQLNSTWLELLRHRHPHRRNSTVADDRQCNWPSWSVQPISAKQVIWVELSCIGVAVDTSPTQLNSTSSWVVSL